MHNLRWARGLSPVLLAWCAGVAVQLQQVALWSASSYAVTFAATFAALAGLALRGRGHSRRFGAWRPMAVCGAVGVLAFAVTAGHALLKVQAIDPALEGQDLVLVGVVQAMPQRQDIGWRFRFEVETAHRVQGGQAVRVPRHVYLGWYGQDGVSDSGWNLSALPEPVQAGERWRLRARLKAPHGNMNPRGFDYELWLWEQGLGATGTVRTGAAHPPPERLAQTWAHPVEWWRQSVRDRLQNRLAPEHASVAGIVVALVTGDQAAIDRSHWDVFRATGVAHLMSISGLHVTMFAWLAAVAMAGCWRQSARWGFKGALRWPAPQVGAVAGLGLAVLYAVFSGWGVPAQRTVWMLGVVTLLRLSARQWAAGQVCLLAAAVVLALDPWALLQPGFWLSFVAVAVLLWTDQRSAVVHRLGAKEGAPWCPAWVRSWVGRLWGLLREQSVVTLALAPLCLLFFGQVSLVGLLANLVAIPWVSFVVTPLAMLGVLWPGLAVWAAWALEPLTALLVWLAAWPAASVQLALPPGGFALLALVAALLWVSAWPRSWKLASLTLLWPALFWTAPRPALGTYELLITDVGQGNAVLVRTAKHSLLYDAGPRYSAESDAGHRVLVPLLSQTAEKLDVLMLSHRDSDHTGGAAAVLAMQPQAGLMSSLEASHPLWGMARTMQLCQRGQRWAWDGVQFEVLHPTAGALDGAEPLAKPNALSCVLRISDGARSVLLAGDIEAPQERALVAAGLDPVDLLLVPHHGSKTSSTPEFLAALQPRLALVQAGYRNRFGHPAPAVVARYQALHIRLIDSPHCGAATWRSDAPEQVVCERERSRRYWHHAPP
ncbi:DNA internalization-related competence protein ComEC/Rec2 [Limnohabitans lacus]|uniref:DNA internalization-related competence protein ComEC/Rec2 n=1 Tax=Limnohabitans lacus TaxID=3045173 RepID=A0ABT6X395_9BURK|nr:DNA internalization-related competence protein ComEC/Rec2 [Limnohabitans sp. HM2-2]MDI9232516.1 DNA internalization-related competence protein ComEC/Rec2 [Limnohabitans sp. HM2-2]